MIFVCFLQYIFLWIGLENWNIRLRKYMYSKVNKKPTTYQVPKPWTKISWNHNLKYIEEKDWNVRFALWRNGWHIEGSPRSHINRRTFTLQSKSSYRENFAICSVGPISNALLLFFFVDFVRFFPYWEIRELLYISDSFLLSIPGTTIVSFLSSNLVLNYRNTLFASILG